MKQADPLINSEAAAISDWIDKFNDSIDSKRDVLSEESSSTITYSLVAVGAIFIAAILGAPFVSARGITSPIERLRLRMLSLARGEFDDVVSGADRKYEVGQMATAVSVFRENAIDRIRLEKEADDGRSLSEKDRIAREVQKAKDVADTQFAVDGLATGLSELSNGNMTYRIEQPFVEHLDQLGANFNAAMAKLQETLRAVGDNAQAISAGAKQIRSASDDLSKRTEQQAALMNCFCSEVS